MPELLIGQLRFWAESGAPPTALNTDGCPRIPRTAGESARGSIAPVLRPLRSWTAVGSVQRHGLHRAGPRAVPGAELAAVGGGRGGGGRGEPERERRVGSLVRLLREPSPERPAGRSGEATAGGQRPRARPDPERQHGFHRPAHPHPHRAGGSQALQDRDPPPGFQLHLAPGQRAAPGRRVPGRAALLPSSLRGQGRRRTPRTAAEHLHFLPEQPAQTGKPEGACWEQLFEGQRWKPSEDATEVSSGQLPVGEGQPKGDPGLGFCLPERDGWGSWNMTVQTGTKRGSVIRTRRRPSRLKDAINCSKGSGLPWRDCKALPRTLVGPQERPSPLPGSVAGA